MDGWGKRAPGSVGQNWWMTLTDSILWELAPAATEGESPLRGNCRGSRSQFQVQLQWSFYAP